MINRVGIKCFYRKISARTSHRESIPVNGVIFDMDGTLTIPVLNFKNLREKLGILNSNVDILSFAENAATQEEKDQRYKVIEDFEEDGNRRLTLQPNLHELFYFLKENNIPRALLTRNNSNAVDSFIQKFIKEDTKDIFKNEKDIFCNVLTRAFTPAKPHPAPIHHICSQWQVTEESVLMVGDDINDIQTGLSAGAVTVRKSKDSTKNVKWGEDLLIDDLSELVGILSTSFEVVRDDVE